MDEKLSADHLIEINKLIHASTEQSKKVLESYSKKLVNDLEEKLSVPLYRDKRFWLGVVTLPGIVLSLQLVNWFLHDPYMLTRFHSFFGTDVAIKEMLSEGKKDDKGRPFSSIGVALEAALIDKLGSSDNKLKRTFDNVIENQVVDGGLITSSVQKTIRQELRGRFVQAFQLGLVRPEMILNCKQEIAHDDRRQDKNVTDCTGLLGAFKNSVTRFFGVLPERNFEIILAVNFQQLVQLEDNDQIKWISGIIQDSGDTNDVISLKRLLSYLDLKMNGQRIILSDASTSSGPSNSGSLNDNLIKAEIIDEKAPSIIHMDNGSHLFYKFRIRNLKIAKSDGSKILPIHQFTLELKEELRGKPLRLNALFMVSKADFESPQASR